MPGCVSFETSRPGPAPREFAVRQPFSVEIALEGDWHASRGIARSSNRQFTRAPTSPSAGTADTVTAKLMRRRVIDRSPNQEIGHSFVPFDAVVSASIIRRLSSQKGDKKEPPPPASHRPPLRGADIPRSRDNVFNGCK